MVLVQRRTIGVSLFMALIGVGLIVAAFSTDHWVLSKPKGVNFDDTNTTKNYGGEVTFGLFRGYSKLNYGVGDRVANLKVKCKPSEKVCAYVAESLAVISESLEEMIEDYNKQNSTDRRSEEWFGLFSFPLYVTTIVTLILAMVFGLITIGFAAFNVFGRPIETITGPSGLFLWNFLSLLFTVVGVCVYAGLYLSQLKKNILTEKNQKKLTSEDQTDLDYSYYLVLGAAGAFLLNIVILAIGGQKLSCSFGRAAEKEVDNGMILY